jgi:hypothetical protein
MKARRAKSKLALPRSGVPRPMLPPRWPIRASPSGIHTYREGKRPRVPFCPRIQHHRLLLLHFFPTAAPASPFPNASSSTEMAKCFVPRCWLFHVSPSFIFSFLRRPAPRQASFTLFARAEQRPELGRGCPRTGGPSLLGCRRFRT